MVGGLLQSFLGALQASISILLVIFYGVLANQFQLLDGPSAKKISTVCVRFFLPALQITKLGSELHADTAGRYVPVLIWAIFYGVVSIGIGWAAVKLFKFPTWVTPALAFNNTTSLPLLLIESLESTGILERLLVHKDTTSKAISRAQAYFLVCAIVGNCLTFALGPRLIDAEHAPPSKDDRNDGQEADEHDQQGGTRNEDNEQTSLLPQHVQDAGDAVEDQAFPIGRNLWRKLSPHVQTVLVFVSDFFNAPLVGAIIGAIIGLTPPLHRAFFNDSTDGGFLNAWLTTSLKQVGELFVSLQVVVVGVRLSASLQKMKRGEDKSLPWAPMFFTLLMRFVIWPVLSIAIIWGLSTRTSVLSDDPILWFTMMLMPVGPSAMSLVAMADVNGADEDEKRTIAKVLTISYAASPIMAFTVVGSLYASQAIIS